MVLLILAGLALLVWLYLALGHSGFWRTSVRLPHGDDPAVWPAVVVVIPARDEADVLPQTLPTLVAQNYPGPYAVLVVDDDSADGTSELARSLGARVIRGSGPPPGWAGKVAAMAAGFAAVDGPDLIDVSGGPEFVLFTDADIAYPPGAVTELVRAAVTHELVLTSQMVRLRVDTFWERVIVPAFVYFFAQLYPFARVNGRGRIAAAAGGCMLVRRAALIAAGGFAPIRDAVIDDVALGRLLARQGRVWLGLSAPIRSVRPYPRLADLWQMVARSAFTQLRYSMVLLAGTVFGLVVVYLVPPVGTIVAAATGNWAAFGVAIAAWAIMALTFMPMLRFYSLSSWRAALLPVVAAMYVGMTIDSARRHHAGRGGAWKGRVAAPR